MSENNYGANPEGTLVLTKGGNYVYIGFAEGRKRPAAATATDTERLALFTTMFSHGGTFKTEGGGNVTFTVTMAWNETWKGQMQKRTTEDRGREAHRANPRIQAFVRWQGGSHDYHP